MSLVKFDMAHVQTLDTFAKGIAKSELLPKDLKGKVGDLIVQMQFGHELGVNPLTAINGIHVIKGKPTLSANLMMTLIEASNKGYINVLEETSQKVTIKGVRYGVKDDDGNKRADREYTTEFSIADASNAGLMGNDNWKKYPKDMLFSKALGRVARRMFADVIMGMYAQGELDGPSFGNGPDTVSDMGLNPQAEVSPAPAEKKPAAKPAKKKVEKKPEPAPIQEAEVVEAEVVQPDAGFTPPGADEKELTYVDEFKNHLLRVTLATELKPAILEWNSIKPEYEVVNHKELGTLVKVRAAFVRNPNLTEEMGDNGTLYDANLNELF